MSQASLRHPPPPVADLKPPDAAGQKRRPPAGEGRIGRIPALDGLRAVAVLGVMLYHAGLNWIPGGLLGVDVFFVISGFLITSLLVAERARNGRIALGQFWLRRARRLLPALVLVLLFVAVCWGLVLHDDVLSLRRDVLFGLGYGANWWFAFSGQGYFQSFAAPSPVLHLWSLSVEEQFYLLWPPIVVLLLARGRRVGRWALAGALLAAGATLGQSLAGVWNGSALLRHRHPGGAAAGRRCAGRLVRHPQHVLAATPSPGGSIPLQLLGLAAAGGIGWAFARMSGQSEQLYRGGFLLLAVAVCAVIASIALIPRGPLGVVLALPVLRYIGRISYGSTCGIGRCFCSSTTGVPAFPAGRCSRRGSPPRSRRPLSATTSSSCPSAAGNGGCVGLGLPRRSWWPGWWPGWSRRPRRDHRRRPRERRVAHRSSRRHAGRKQGFTGCPAWHRPDPLRG